MENTNYQDDEIDLRDLINHLIKSKIIIITTTFIFVLMAASYNYFLAPQTIPVYQSTALLVTGNVDNKPLSTKNLISTLRFYFPEVTSIHSLGHPYIEIKLNGTSIEKNTIKLNELIDYALSDSEEKIEKRKQQIKLEISNIDMEIANINYALDILPSEVDLTNNVESVFYLNTLKYEKRVLETKALSTKNNLEAGLYSTTNIHGEIKSNQIRNTRDIKHNSITNIIFSTIAGLLLSIFALTFRYAFLKK